MGALGDGGEGSFDDAEAFVELLVGDDERDEDADDVVEGAGGDGDEAVLVARLGEQARAYRFSRR